jgi:3',5'-cyclic AMP phosphodiesterase CpdA
MIEYKYFSYVNISSTMNPTLLGEDLQVLLLNSGRMTMPKTLGKELFKYAVVADTHVNYSETECNSEFEINKRANARLRHVVKDLNQQDLVLVIHLGDIVHPVPAVPDLYTQAAKCFHEQVAELRHPLYLVPGNHDIGDKPITWSPGAVACDEYIALWTKTFGVNYQSIESQGCRFFIIDTQILNSGLVAEAEQKVWLEVEIAKASESGQRIFFHMHYPLFLTTPDEDEHFDNIAEPCRSWLLGLMEHYEVEAQFSGHVHNFWYNRFGLTDCYALPSTAFVRQDYSEMYRATPLPGTEGGRSDLAKLGYFLIHVHENGHFCQWVRTFGEFTESGTTNDAPTNKVTPLHPMQNPNTRFGFDMRQNWLEIVEIPPSGSLDEFDRKRIRNDYALMALIETGVKRVRIPVSDLFDPDHRKRLDDCACQGFQFTLFSFGVPNQRLLDAVSAAKGLIDIWEICDTAENLPKVVMTSQETVKRAGVALYLSRIRTREDQEKSSGTYHHMIVHGYFPEDIDHIAQMAELDGVEGLVFRTEGLTPPWQAARAAINVCQPHGLKASLHVRMSVGAPGLKQVDDDWAAARVGESLAVTWACEDVHVYIDTFADVDRGYYRRHGIVDRFYNPRPAFNIVRNLNGALAGGRTFFPGQNEDNINLIDASGRCVELVHGETPPLTSKDATTGILTNLYTGQQSTVTRQQGGAFSPVLSSPLSLWMPDN